MLRLARSAALRSLAATLLWTAVACSGGEDDRTGEAVVHDTGPSSTEATPAAPPKEREPIDAATTGAIRGTVLFQGTPPAMKELAIGASTGCPGHADPHFQETVLVEDGKLRNVFVYVKRGLEGWVLPPAADERVVLEQRGCLYRPHVVALQAGQTLFVTNEDPLAHNVNVSAPRNNLSGNRTQGLGGSELEFPFKQREHLVRFKCDIHPWMGAWVFVEEHPFFAVSGVDGRFEISGLPPGEYVLEAVHEDTKGLGKRSVTVVVPASGSVETSLTFGS